MVQYAASKVALHLIALSGVRASPSACKGTESKFDWRKLNKVSKVQDQGSCGDCWAFAAIGAYEANYLIQNNLTNGAVDTSEQQALDCAWPAYDCNGGWHDKVLTYLEKPGEVTRALYSYAKPPTTPTKGYCIPQSSPSYFASTWSPVSSAGSVVGAVIPSKSDMKAAICQHGPIVAAVSAASWDDLTADGYHYKYSTANPNWKQDFPTGVFTGSPSNPSLTMDTLQPTDIDHDVVIVGWDDNLNAWIIKNSWGTDWGDGGFIYLAYDTANIGFNAAWVQAKISDNIAKRRNPKLSPQTLLQLNEDLKSLNSVLQYGSQNNKQ